MRGLRRRRGLVHEGRPDGCGEGEAGAVGRPPPAGDRALPALPRPQDPRPPLRGSRAGPRPRGGERLPRVDRRPCSAPRPLDSLATACRMWQRPPDLHDRMRLRPTPGRDSLLRPCCPKGRPGRSGGRRTTGPVGATPGYGGRPPSTPPRAAGADSCAAARPVTHQSGPRRGENRCSRITVRAASGAPRPGRRAAQDFLPVKKFPSLSSVSRKLWNRWFPPRGISANRVLTCMFGRVNFSLGIYIQAIDSGKSGAHSRSLHETKEVLPRGG